MKKIVFTLLCLSLAGCMTPEEMAEQRRQQEQADIQTCLSYGLKRTSEAFGMCRLQLDLARQQQYYYDRDYFSNDFHHPRGMPYHYLPR